MKPRHMATGYETSVNSNQYRLIIEPGTDVKHEPSPATFNNLTLHQLRAYIYMTRLTAKALQRRHKIAEDSIPLNTRSVAPGRLTSPAYTLDKRQANFSIDDRSIPHRWH